MRNRKGATGVEPSERSASARSGNRAPSRPVPVLDEALSKACRFLCKSLGGQGFGGRILLLVSTAMGGSSVVRTEERRARVLLLFVACALLITAAAVSPRSARAQSYHPAVDPEHFPVPSSLIPAIEFWTDVFAEHESTKVVFHDDRLMGIVYSVLDLSDLENRSAGAKDREKRRRVRKEKERIQSILRHLSGETRVRVDEAEARKIRALFSGVGGGQSKYRQAISRIRTQTGLRDRFAEAIEISGMFMPGIERTLASYRLPEQLKCMPFVESMFNYKARSKVGASGAWQFTRSTGRMFLQIDAAVDARSDVLLAAEGAAKMLARDYERLKYWPVTVTAYNHGSAGMARAVRRHGRDIAEIVDNYRSRTFGFASRNFYAELIAAIVVFAERDRYFPGVEQMPELKFDVLETGKFVSLLDLAQLTGTSEKTLVDLNPALSGPVHRGTLLVPKTYPLRVPEGQLASFQKALRDIPRDRKLDRQLAHQYTVRSGDTLGKIAERFSSSVRSIQQANNLPRADRIYVGQRLEIPSRGNVGWQVRLPAQRASTGGSSQSSGAAPVAADGTVESGPARHRVRRGESLSAIAARYRVSMDVLISANGIARPDQLQIGQILEIPPSGSRLHRVRRGETLVGIAGRYGISLRELMTANSLRGSLIRVGQMLRVPPSS